MLVLGVGAIDLPEHLDDRAQAIEGSQRGVDRSQAREHDAVKLDREPGINVVLRPEVLVDGSLADLRLLRDLFDRDALPTIAVRQRQRRAEQIGLAAMELAS